MLSGRRPALASAASARAGYFAYDTMTLVGPGTWEAARAALGAAVTAAEAVAAGEAAAYACCRPPGHHRDPEQLRRLLLPQQRRRGSVHELRVALGEPVAVIDIDAHHGNGAGFSTRTSRSWSRSVRRPGEPAGSRISSAGRDGAGRAPALTATSAWRRAQATGSGWRRSPSSPAGSRARARGRWWSRSGSTPPAPIPSPARGQRRRVPGRGRGAGRPRAAHRRRPGGL